MSRIFICYRRDDASGHAGRLRDALSARFGAHEIFRDLDTIGPGDDFVRAMSAGIDSCAVFLAVIGRRWLTAESPGSPRRLDDPDDHVRNELARALARQCRVIPVLVQGAAMPRAGDLPEPLKGLTARNAIALDDEGWDSAVERLAAAIRRELPGAAVTAPPRSAPYVGRRYAVAALVAAVVIAAVVFLTRGRSRDASGPPNGPGADAQLPAAAGTVAPASKATATSGPATGATAGQQTAVTLPAGGRQGSRFDITIEGGAC